MDEFLGRRTACGLLLSKSSSSIVLRDSTENKDCSPRICSRVGCSSKLSSLKAPKIGLLDKAKSSAHSFRPSTTGKEIIGSSSQPSGVNGAKKPLSISRKKLSSQLKTTDSETSSTPDESETSESNGKTRIKHQSKLVAFRGDRHWKKNKQKFVLCNQDSTSLGSSISKHTRRGAKISASENRYNFSGFKCHSISDGFQSGCCSSELSLGRKRDVGRKRTSETESSLSARGKKIEKIGSPAFIDDRRNVNLNRGISISESRRSVMAPGRENDAISVRTQRSASRSRLSDQRKGSRLQFLGSSPSSALSPQSGLVFHTNVLSPENQSSIQASSSHAHSSSHPVNVSENMGSIRSSAYEYSIPRSLMNRDGLRQYNLEGIAEVLFALDRIEQDEDLSYEQLLALETNIFLDGLTLHDQHRDMRLDIDNMSYEELLALEERMGSVSTALTEEELQKYLKKTIYQISCSELGSVSSERSCDDIKCSICQEEYIVGEEVGKLECDHAYHAGCIQKWLQLKNWCPICKAAAAASSSSHTPPALA